VIWLATVFAEFMGPFNVLHQPLSLSAVAWGFWAVSAVAEAYTLVYLLDRGRSERTSQGGALLAGRQELR
jgi:bacteriorhodopsin